jgi:hypothetical protein
MTQANDLTSAAKEGYDAPLGGKTPHDACPHSLISPPGLAWLVGATLKRTGRTSPRDVHISRGLTVWANDMLFDCHDVLNITRIK